MHLDIWLYEAVDLLKGPAGGLRAVIHLCVHHPGGEGQHGIKNLMHQDIHIDLGLEDVPGPLDQLMELPQMLLIGIGTAIGTIIVADIEDAIIGLFQNKLPDLLPVQEGPLLGRNPGQMQQRQVLPQLGCEIFIFLMERRTEQLILSAKSFIDVRFIQPGLGGDGLGGGLLQSVSGDDVNGAFHKYLFHFLLLQAANLRSGTGQKELLSLSTLP